MKLQHAASMAARCHGHRNPADSLLESRSWCTAPRREPVCFLVSRLPPTDSPPDATNTSPGQPKPQGTGATSGGLHRVCRALLVSPTLPSTQRIRFRRSRGFAVQLLVTPQDEWKATTEREDPMSSIKESAEQWTYPESVDG